MPDKQKNLNTEFPGNLSQPSLCKETSAILETPTDLTCFMFWKKYRKRIIIATTAISLIIVALVITGLTAGVGGVVGGIITALMLSIKGYGGKIIAGLLVFSISEIVGNAAPVFFKKITTPKLIPSLITEETNALPEYAKGIFGENGQISENNQSTSLVFTEKIQKDEPTNFVEENKMRENGSNLFFTESEDGSIKFFTKEEDDDDSFTFVPPDKTQGTCTK